jgi:PKD repeat protein
MPGYYRFAYIFCLALLATIVITAPIRANNHIIYVPTDVSSIQAAIDAAQAGDEIIVASGVYMETIDFLGKAITLKSAEGPLLTIIDGSNSIGSVIQTVNGEGPDTIIEGFTVTGGNVSDNGGGMLNIGTSPTVRHMIFTDNHAGDRGGGMYNRNANPLVEDSLFEGNSSGAMGGGMFNIEGSQPIVVRSRFTANTSHKGGGMRNYLNSDAFVSESIFSLNVAESEGGGMDNRKNSNVTVMNTMFIGNTAGDGGGAMHNYAGRAEDTGDQLFVNLLIVGNTAPSGAGIRNNDESPIMINVTVADNEGVGISSRNGSAPKIVNSIVWGNTGGSFSGKTAYQADVRYSDIEGGFAGNGNLNIDPQFENPAANDYRLAAASQLINAGSNILLLQGQVEDLDGKSRIIWSTVDMGPYEYGDCAAGETCGPSNLAPTASFDLFCNDLICSFMDTSEDIDGMVDAWSWSFGDGNVSTNQNPVYEFAAAGMYEVVLTVADNEGATSLPEMQQISVGMPASVLSIESISPTSMSVSDSVLLVITGNGFADDAEVSLSGGSGPIKVSNIMFNNSQTIEATITTNSGGPPKPRVWDVTVNSGGASATLSKAFTVQP